ncbi:efflux RND transporter periplasmic adaptor subunit [Sphingomonas sp. So64.6b]|uniref:efflux RND transporter periplasmic adaptor subunit n=1 Tax=Sphingomonas sp. So64.6b TaxID=2997354 RepID=UPI0016030402|nr:efflux RND transporter periplasmic adaptor subunit [Sphingomonas sp. So64.6b]QNA82773.1 efflux RND transporter periplasmic adaptor subunit [Sphingomonas sp. So64.6b]
MADSNLDEFLGAKPQPAWQRYLKWVLIAIGVILLALAARSYFGGGGTPDYTTEKVAQGSFQVTVSATGKLAPTNQVQVGSELSGLVTKVVVDVNDRVVVGQPLALVDPSRFQDTVNQSKAALAANVAAVAQAQATLSQSSAQLARLQEVSRLSGGRVPAKTEMEQAIADRSRAVANLRAAQANVQSAQATLSSNATQLVKTVIRSPVNGVVLARQIEPGQTVAASFSTPTLFVIAEDLSAMKLEVAIDEADVGSVKQGQKATFTVDAFPGQTFPADITRVDLGSNLSAQTTTTTASTTTAQVVSYGATLSVANPKLELRPGMTATADIVTTAKSNVLLVPNAALRFKPDTSGTPAASSSGGIAGALVPSRPRRGGGGGGGARTAKIERGGHQTVYIKDETGQPKAIDITTGETNGSVTEVTGGDLKPGMEVITGQLASGDKASSRSGGGQRRRQGASGGAASGQ